jgi:hypothetical protein
MASVPHTPGPWRAAFPPDYRPLEGEDHDEITTVPHFCFDAIDIFAPALGRLSTIEEHFGNARLMAAAPEMYAACVRIRNLASGYDADGALGPVEPLSWESVARIAMDLAVAALAKAEGR